MKKSDRKIVYNKCGGKCAYCGDELKSGWHVDHANAVERKYKRVGGGYFHNVTEEPITDENRPKKLEDWRDFTLRESKLVQDGYYKPENDTIENMLPACPSCNINKHSMNVEEFRAFIARFVASLNKANTQYKVAKRYGLIVETNIPIKFYFEK